MSNPPSVLFSGGALDRPPVARWCLPPVLQWPAARRGLLGIGYRVAGGRLRGQVEIACRAQATQALTTLAWSAPLDAVSRRVLAEALRRAAGPEAPARLHVFAAAARQLFRHTVLTLAHRPGNRTRRHRAPHGPADASVHKADGEPSSLHDDLLTAIDDLSNAAGVQPRVTLTDCAAVDVVTGAILPTLYALFADLAAGLERALRPLEPHIGRDAARAIILETRRALDDLAAGRTGGDVYVESLTVTGAADKPMNIEIEASVNAAP